MLDMQIYLLLVDHAGSGVICRVPTCFWWHGYDEGDNPPGIERLHDVASLGVLNTHLLDDFPYILVNLLACQMIYQSNT